MSKIRIAIVEDETIYQKMFTSYIRRYAEENGLDTAVTVLSDGLEITEEYEPAWDLILMDIQGGSAPMKNAMSMYRIKL